MKCNKCNKPNRDIARYCKWCGEPIAASQSTNADPFDTLVDKDEICKLLRDTISKAKHKAEKCKQFNPNQRMQLSFVISGTSGSGKLTIAKALTQALFNADIVRSPKPMIIDATDYDEWIKDADANATNLANSVVIFKDSHKLIGGDSESDSPDIIPLDHAIKLVRDWREIANKPIFIFIGDNRLNEFFDNNPQSASAINLRIRTNEISIDGLVKIATMILRDEYHLTLSKDAADKLYRIFVYDRRSPKEAKGNGGHNARARAYEIDLNAISMVGQDNTITADMISGKEYKPKKLSEVMDEFNKYVGVDEIKEAVRSVANSIEADVKRGKEPKITHHYQFLGNPGTGKTTMARLFAEALNAMGALPIGHLVEVSKDDLVSQYVGESSKKVVDLFQKAMGGVLFIDEAYQLGNDDHGKDAVDTLLKLAEDYRGKIVVILAGYTREMGEFMTINSGLTSRFDKVINFRDYTAEELTEIFRRMVNSSDTGLRMDSDADSQVINFFRKMWLTRTANFGNAREVRTAYNNTLDRVHNRMQANPNSPFAITMADIEGVDRTDEKTVDEILNELDDMVGMDSVKSQLRKIGNSVRLERKRMERGLGGASINNIHIAITGNPGTGKTEVAKRLGRIFKAMGILAKGHVVERERKTLLDSYANSAGNNMEKAVDEALGGVLFIDEAYNLIPANDPSRKDQDGTAAIDALMTRMSNDAGKFVTVIAGYKTEIDEFIANANPGLARRFTHRIHIDDYNADQLVEIFKRKAKSSSYQLSPEADELLQRKVEEMVTMKQKGFGNAGEMIKLFNETCERQGSRLGDIDRELTDEELCTIEACDIPYDPPRKVDVALCMRELDKLVGLQSVKQEIHNLIDVITTEQERAKEKGERPNIYMRHYLFMGNPGTGKTTVARLMGDIFYSLGLLPSNKLIEVVPGDMIVGYIGQTAAKVRQTIERGVGGILFIDEAYGLNDGPNGFGTRDAMPELLKLLNDYRGKMVCIAAGYPREMQEWVNLNSGLPRRFDGRINFEDYTSDELVTIFKNLVKKEGMTIDDNALTEVQNYFDVLVYNKGANFGNAAEAVMYFNKVKIRQGMRLRRMVSYDRSELYILRREDMIVS